MYAHEGLEKARNCELQKERVGFEPTVLLQTPDFESDAINQTPPPLPKEECVGFEPTIHLAMNSGFQDQCDQPDSANTPNTIFSKPITRIPLLI